MIKKNQYFYFFSFCMLFLASPALTLQLSSLRFAIPGTATGSPPSELESYADRCIDLHAFETLIIESNGVALPGLAESWTSDSATNWNITIKKGILFQDGSPFTIEDIGKCLSTLNNSIPQNLPFKNIKNFSTHSNTINIKLFMPDPDFLLMLALPRTAIWKKSPNGKFPIGTGPFQLEEVIRDRAIMKGNKNFKYGQPPLERIEFLFLTNDGKAKEMIASGSAHASWLSIDDYISVEKEKHYGLKILTVQTHNIIQLRFNNNHTLFTNYLVRKAITEALGRDSYRVLFAGQPFLEAGLQPYSAQVHSLNRDIMKAKEHLSKYAVPPGMTLQYSLVFGNERLLMEKTALSLEEAGFIRLKTKKISERSLSGSLNFKKFEFAGEILYADTHSGNYYKIMNIEQKITAFRIPLYCPSVIFELPDQLEGVTFSDTGIPDLRNARWKKEQP